jgi:hypothetical protein
MKTVFARQIPCLIGCLIAMSMNARSQSTSTISSNFNGTAISGTSYIWFNAHLTSVSFAGEAVTAPVVVLYVKNSRVTFTSKDGVPYDIAIPDATLRFSQSVHASSPTGSYTGGKWDITYAKSGSKDPFFSGLMWKVPHQGLPGGTNPVSWTAEFSSNIGTVSEVKWQWSAAVYTQAPSDPNHLGVAWVDGSRQSGSPMAYLSFVTGGARGGGGSNSTGSNSSTGSVKDIDIGNPTDEGDVGDVPVSPPGDPARRPVGELVFTRNLLLRGTMTPVGYEIIRQ